METLKIKRTTLSTISLKWAHFLRWLFQNNQRFLDDNVLALSNVQWTTITKVLLKIFKNWKFFSTLENLLWFLFNKRKSSVLQPICHGYSQYVCYSQYVWNLIQLKRLAYLLYGSVASLPSPSSNIEAWHVAPLRFAPAFRALGVREQSWLRYNDYSDKMCRDHTYIIGTTLSKEKSLATTLSQQYRCLFVNRKGEVWRLRQRKTHCRHEPLDISVGQTQHVYIDMHGDTSGMHHMTSHHIASQNYVITSSYDDKKIRKKLFESRYPGIVERAGMSSMLLPIIRGQFFFTKHWKFLEPAWRNFVELQCSVHYLS